MKTAKQEAMELIQRLPDHASLETILAELHFRQRVLRGLEQLERDEVVSHHEAKKHLEPWLTSSGQQTP